MPQPGVQPDAIEVPRERAHVGSDRHAVVVEHDRDRRSEPTSMPDRLEGHPAGHAAVADDRDDLAVGLGASVAHALLDAHRIADRGRGVTRAHDALWPLPDRAERRQPAVLAYRAQA